MEPTGIGDFVRRKRNELGITQAELADRAAISRARVAQIEGGRVTLPGADHRRRLADALGVSHLDILVAAGEITEDELQTAGKAGVVKRSHIHTIADQLCDLAQAINWEMLPGTASGLLEVLGETAEKQRARRAAARPPRARTPARPDEH